MSNVRLKFTTHISAPPTRVSAVMLAPDTYTQWTSAFAEGSRFEGSWDEGETIRFLSPSGDGMRSVVAVHRAHDFLSLRHEAMVSPSGDLPAEHGWFPAYENYTFKPDGAGTTLTVEQDVPEEWAGDLRAAWPSALAALKALAQA